MPSASFSSLRVLPTHANNTLETAILADDLSALSDLCAYPPYTPLHALIRFACLSRSVAFSHLLSCHPSLTDSFKTDDLLFAALGGGSVSIWRIILAHRPEAKNQRFGHYGTVLEQCVMMKNMELLKYLLAEGARVEMPGRPILLRARLCGASEEMNELLLSYGATTEFDEEDD